MNEFFLVLTENYINLQELLQFSTQLHKNQINSIIDHLKEEKSNYERWCELLYSILVGTQIKTDRAKFCYEQLLDEYFDLLDPIFLKESRDYSSLRELIENSLKVNGYRFYKSKSEVIYNAILFFKDYSFDIGTFIAQYSDYKLIRKELMKIAGIGYKIASHWLRNMGFYIPVIDLHIKNLLFKFNIINDNNISYRAYEKIQNRIIQELEIDNISFDLALWYYGKNYCSSTLRCSKCKFNLICRK